MYWLFYELNWCVYVSVEELWLSIYLIYCNQVATIWYIFPVIFYLFVDILNNFITCHFVQHINVIFYHLRKDSKQQTIGKFKYITANYFFNMNLDNAYHRYYPNMADKILSMHEDYAQSCVVIRLEKSIANIIKSFNIPAELLWHLVDEVYVPVNMKESVTS